MSRHDVDAIGGAWYDWQQARYPVLSAYGFDRRGRGAHRALAEQSVFGPHIVVDLFGLRFNETTGQCHPSRLVGK